MLPRLFLRSRGRAASNRTAAEGYKQAVIARAQGDADRFTLLQAQYKNAPEVTRKRLWLETIQQVLEQNRTGIGADGRQLIYVPIASDVPRLPATTIQGGVGNAPPVSQDLLIPESLSKPSNENIRNPQRVVRPAGREGAPL